MSAFRIGFNGLHGRYRGALLPDVFALSEWQVV